MTTVAGASRYVNAATLANTRGLSAQSPTLLGSSDTTSLLSAGRNIAPTGIGFGVSQGARQINQQLLSRSADVNAMFSLAVGSGATIDGARQEILALRARFSDNQLASNVRGSSVDTEA